MNNKQKRFSVTDRIRSFRYAFEGLRYFIRNEHNGRVQIVAAVLAIGLSWYLQLSKMEWVAIFSAIAMVIGAEIFNSAIEKLADIVSPEYHPKIKLVKDLAAAGVLLFALLAMVIAAIIFIPRLLS